MTTVITNYDKLTRRVLIEKQIFKKSFQFSSEKDFEKSVIFIEQMGGFTKFFQGINYNADNYKDQHIITANRILSEFKKGEIILYKEIEK